MERGREGERERREGERAERERQTDKKKERHIERHPYM